MGTLSSVDVTLFLLEAVFQSPSGKPLSPYGSFNNATPKRQSSSNDEYVFCFLLSKPALVIVGASEYSTTRWRSIGGRGIMFGPRRNPIFF